MAGTAYTSFAVGDPNINAVMLNLAGINTGYNALTLTQMSTTTVPAIAAGSKIEVGGTLFKFDANEAISGSPSDGTVYIMLVPSGSSITAQFTNTAPTWSDSKQGWYGTGGSAGNRYLDWCMYKSASEYRAKRRFADNNKLLNLGTVISARNSISTLTINTTPQKIPLPSGFIVSDFQNEISSNTINIKNAGKYLINASFSGRTASGSVNAFYFYPTGTMLTPSTAYLYCPCIYDASPAAGFFNAGFSSVVSAVAGSTLYFNVSSYGTVNVDGATFNVSITPLEV